MIRAILLSCLTITASAIPVHPSIAPLLPAQEGALPPVLATNQILEAQTQPPISPNLPQLQPGGPQFLPPMLNYPWSPQGGNPFIFPMVPNIPASQPVNQPTLSQQPMIFSPYGYFPVFTPQHVNQMFSPYRFPMIVEGPQPQIPGNQLPNSPVSPGETPSGTAPVGNTLLTTQQEQNRQVVYLLPPMNSPLGGLSSEELEMAARLGRLGVYIPDMNINVPAGAAQPLAPVSQATGPANPGQPMSNLPSSGVLPTTGTSVPNTNSVPAGFERPGPDMISANVPFPPKNQPTQGNCP